MFIAVPVWKWLAMIRLGHFLDIQKEAFEKVRCVCIMAIRAVQLAAIAQLPVSALMWTSRLHSQAQQRQPPKRMGLLTTNLQNWQACMIVM